MLLSKGTNCQYQTNITMKIIGNVISDSMYVHNYNNYYDIRLLDSLRCL